MCGPKGPILQFLDDLIFKILSRVATLAFLPSLQMSFLKILAEFVSEVCFKEGLFQKKIANAAMILCIQAHAIEI